MKPFQKMYFAVFLGLILGAAMSFVSCSDDDDDKKEQATSQATGPNVLVLELTASCGDNPCM